MNYKFSMKYFEKKIKKSINKIEENVLKPALNHTRGDISHPETGLLSIFSLFVHLSSCFPNLMLPFFQLAKLDPTASAISTSVGGAAKMSTPASL